MPDCWLYFKTLTPDEFNKIALALVAVIALFLGPFMQWMIARRQVLMQEEIARRQVLMQEEIAKRQTETQQQIAKRQIADSISSRRQIWIDELRKDASECVALLTQLKGLQRPAPNLCIEDQKKNFEEEAAALSRARELTFRINLRLNPGEEEHNKLAVLLTTVMSNLGTSPPLNETMDQKQSDINAFERSRRDFVKHLQTILKHEWERVKRGDI